MLVQRINLDDYLLPDAETIHDFFMQEEDLHAIAETGIAHFDELYHFANEV